MDWTIIIGIVIIAALALGLLLLPVTIHMGTTRVGTSINGNVIIRWLILQVRYTVKDKRTVVMVFGRKIMSKEETPATEDIPIPEKKIPEESTRSWELPPVGLFVNVAGPVIRLVEGLVRTIYLNKLDFDVTYGFEDPASTGILTGYLHAIQGALPVGKTFSFAPDFTVPVLEWDAQAAVTITPARVIVPVTRFVANWQVLRAGWILIRG